MQEGAKGQEDGDAWMAEGPDEVDKELQAAQAELDASSKGKAARGTAQGEAAADQGFDPGEFARRMQVCHGVSCAFMSHGCLRRHHYIV